MELPKINLVIVGHLDHGKSTLIGRLLYDAGAIQKLKLKELKETTKDLKREFEFAYIMDSFEEEIEGGLTIDIMQTPFKSKKHEYAIIDCPGHKEFIKNMISGASKADAAILVVSAKKEEGVQEQTKRHTFLLKLLGVNQLIVVINKMDTVNYDRKIFDKICNKVKIFLKSIGLNTEKIQFIPISAKEGDNVFRSSEKILWYNGPTLIDALDATITPLQPPIDKPLRIPVQNVYGEENLIMGKIETGILKLGKSVIFEPSGIKREIESIETFGEKKKEALPGDSIGFRVKEAKEVKRGEVCSYLGNPPKVAKKFTAEIVLLSELEIKVGDNVIIRCGTVEKECKIEEIIEKIDSEKGTTIKEFPDVIKSTEAGVIKITPSEPIIVEKFSDIPQLGRFIVIKKNKITAAGIVLDVS